MENKNKKIVIGIDVDGVLRDNLSIMVDLYNEAFDDDKRVEDIKDYKVEKSFPRIEEETGMKPSEWFFQAHSKEIFLDAPECPNALAFFQQLKNIPNTHLAIVTYQKSYINRIHTLTWLQQHGFLDYADSVIFARDKSIVNCDVLVDDNVWNHVNGDYAHNVIINMPYNRNENIPRSSRYDTFAKFAADYCKTPEKWVKVSE